MVENIRLEFDPQLCRECEGVDCMTRCRYVRFEDRDARTEWLSLLEGESSHILSECLTCYACEEYCPHDNHPFLFIVERQEQEGILPVPSEMAELQMTKLAPSGRIRPTSVSSPVIDMCTFPMLKGCVRGGLFEGASVVMGRDIFCNIMWLHFARNSMIRERLPWAVENIWTNFLENNGIDELICFHDECYAAFASVAPAIGLQVPFKPVHLFDYLIKRLDDLDSKIKPVGKKVAYQRPCSNRLVPKTNMLAGEIFQRIGAEFVDREYSGEESLCCGGILRLMGKVGLADDIVRRNVEDMQAAGAEICVFNCPMCMFVMGQDVSEKGIRPLLMSELCQEALGEEALDPGGS